MTGNRGAGNALFRHAPGEFGRFGAKPAIDEEIGMLFIMGAGRSGTSWLARLFDSHPDVLYRHEPDSVLYDQRVPYMPEPEDVEPLIPATRDFVDRLARSGRLKAVGKVPLFDKSYRSTAAKHTLEAMIYGSKAAQRLLSGVPAVQQLELPDMVRAGHQPLTVIKTVSSLGRTHLFSRAVPEARFVHILRHPCGTISSHLRGVRQGLMKPDVYLKSVFASRQSEHYPFTRAELEQRTVEEQLAYQWMLNNDKVTTEMEGDPRYYRLRYEDLCADPKGVMRELMAFAGLDWSPQTDAAIDGTVRSESDQDEAYFSTRKAPLKAAMKWKDELDAATVDRIMGIVAHGTSGRLFLEESSPTPLRHTA